MAEKFLKVENGRTTEKEAITSSAGAADSGKLVGLDGGGRLDPSVMPVGIGADVKALELTEDVSAGDYVNIFDDAGTPKARLADQSNDRAAHGFVKAAGLTGETVNVFFEGPNSGLSSLTAGARYYLASNGDITNSAPAAGLLQFLGVAIDDTQINTDISDVIVRA